MLSQNGNEAAHFRRMVRWGIIGLFVLIGAAIVVSILFRAFVAPGPYYPGFFFFPFGLLFLFLLFFGFRWFFRPWGWGWGYRPGYWGQGQDAVEILKQRYARGELTRDQFEQMMRDVQQGR